MKHLVFVTVLLSTVCVFGQTEGIWLHPNRGQWDEQIDYKVDLQQGSLLLNQEGFTYCLNDGQSHEHSDNSAEEHPDKIHCQIIKSAFVNPSWKGEIKEQNTSSFYRNYYLGKDASKWRSEVRSVQQVTYTNYYEGIDFQVSGVGAKLKYAFIVAPGADPSKIQTVFSGSDKITLKDGALLIATDFGDIVEEQPIAWTEKDGERTTVAVRFVLKGNLLSYEFPEGYDRSATLVVDPNIVFSTFTGSTMDNWGMTATPDSQGNLYAGGIVFAGGGSYPTVVGSFDVSFNSGTPYTYTFNGGTYSLNGFDVAISKFNATGTSLIFSTYLGGSDNESVHSLVTDAQDHLYVLGVTGSTNFPTVNGCIDQSFNGGPTISTNELGFTGTDMYVTHFNQAGTALVGSTYLGGSGTDGINAGSLYFNYGDPFRGEIVVKNASVYVVSSTSSSDFPTLNAFQSSLNGAQDAVVIKMNTGLTAMAWSTYLGGSGYDSGNGVQLSSTGDIYIAGGTTSSNLPIAVGYDLTYNGGIADGYVLRMTSTGTVTSGTYVGTNEYDQTFFVQLDQDDAVYIYGQSEGTIPITAGCYGVANSGQSVMKFSTNLLSLLWSTAIGAGTGHVEISPTAFLVSNCKDIYLSGWGGTINVNYSPGATNSSTYGFQTTPDAYQSATNGSNFWISVLDADAAFLKYATFIGGTTASYNHVDGGTSRFDKNGNIYHAVCGACGGNDYGFTTTPGVWSPNNPSPNCNLAAFKFELSSIQAIVSNPAPLICLPDPIVFQNNSANGNDFFWNFGDGATSTLVNPTHVYSGPGQYTVTLVVTDTNQCYAPDSIDFLVNIGDFQGGVVNPDIIVCSGLPAQLEAYGGATYSWSPTQYLNNPAIANPIATVTQNTTFHCVISDSCGVDTVQVQVNVVGGNVQVAADTSICLGNSVPLFIQGVISATWTPASFLDDPNSLTPIATPLNTITYQVSGTTADGCTLTEDVTIQVFFDPPAPNMPDTLKYCEGTSQTVTVSGATLYAWSPTNDITPTTGATVTISTDVEQYYYCDFTNACGTERDSMYIDLVQPAIFAGYDTIVCPGEPAFLYAWGGISYTWYPDVTPLLQDGSEVSVIAPEPAYYQVVGVDQYGCLDSASVFIDLFPKPFIQTNPDVYAVFGEPVPLSATSTTSGPYTWSPSEYLSCVVCTDPIALPNKDFVYTVSYTDENGCTASDQVHIYYEPLIYVPNTFTPNGDFINEDFFALGVNIDDFNLEIYDRWGELIYTGDRMSKAWDGTYLDKPCQDGVYVWKIRYTEFETDVVYELVGHVSLLR